jgi:hypothetical protein
MYSYYKYFIELVINVNFLSVDLYHHPDSYKEDGNYRFKPYTAPTII